MRMTWYMLCVMAPGKGSPWEWIMPDARRIDSKEKARVQYNPVMSKNDLTHLDQSGRARMVDVGDKPESERWAVAKGLVVVSPETFARLRAGDVKKGDVRAVAELAGVMAAKRTAELIPLCHPLALTHIEVTASLDESLPGVALRAKVSTTSRTGVEMEALTAVSVAALTVYDMIKAIERSARIADIRLVEKHGGQSGDVILEAE
jgi:cyclic pyranopterin phosphate synthase